MGELDEVIIESNIGSSKYPVNDWGKWVKADGGTLSEIIFLIHGIFPGNALNVHSPHSYSDAFRAEFQQQIDVYELAERSILLGKLSAEKNERDYWLTIDIKRTESTYWVGIDDVLEWAITKKVGTPEVIKQLMSARKHFANEHSANSSNTKKKSHLQQIKERAIPLIKKRRANYRGESNSSLIKALKLKSLFKKQNGQEYGDKFWLNTVRGCDETPKPDRFKRKRERKSRISKTWTK